MTLEERFRTSSDATLAVLSARLDKDVREMVEQLLAIALEEREAALDAVRQAAIEEAAADTKRQIEEAESLVRAATEQAIVEARDDERAKVATEIRKLVEAEAESRINEADAAAELRMKAALADADARAEQRLRDGVGEARAREREAEMAALTRLLESIRGLDGASSLSEVLDALGQAAGREASRAAVLVLRNDRLLGWKLNGFGSRDTQPKTIDMSLTESGVIGAAAGAARPVTTRDNPAAAEGPGFAPLPPDRMGFAVPVIVSGRVVAVIYADGASEGREHVVPSGWPEVIEVLARHAARCLEALTAQRTAASPRGAVQSSSKQSPGATPSAKALSDPGVSP
jgi:hypothetical protein